MRTNKSVIPVERFYSSRDALKQSGWLCQNRQAFERCLEWQRNSPQENPVRRSVQFLSVALCMAAAAAVCPAQTEPKFGQHVSASGAAAANIYSVDLNNDGIPDILADTAKPGNGFNVQLGNGDGTFKAPVFHAVTGGNGSPMPMATGDFNNDGKADVAVLVPGKNLIDVFLGNGNGTFQAVRYSYITLRYGETLASAPMVAADLNRDGKIDLAVVGISGEYQTVYALAGDGTGEFGVAPKVIASLPSSYTVGNMVTGDFDGDAKADVAFTQVFGCTTPGSCVTNLHVLFGDGSFGFVDTTPYNAYDLLQISAGDVDSDGKSDIVSFDPTTQQIMVMYGEGDRVFPSYWLTVGDQRFPLTYASGWSGPFQIADFNGDGRMDIAVFQTNTIYEVGNYAITIELGTANRGQFTSTPAYVPSSADPAMPFGTAPVAIDTNGDGRPDLVISETAAASGDHSAPTTLVAEVNTTSGGNFGGCTYPKSAQGIALCSPAASNSGNTVSFKAAATSFGNLRKIELWVDGKKLAQNFHAWEHNGWFNYTGTFAAGAHKATLYANDVDNRQQRLDTTFVTGATAGCSAPSSNGVHVCSPVSGSTGSSPLSVQATAKVAGTLARMEVWVDGVKKFTETTSLSLTTSVNVGAGSHRIDVYAVNTAGTKYETTVQATVK